MDEKNKVIEIKREVILKTVYDAYEEEFSDMKDIILGGIKFKGLDNMTDRELAKDYKDILYINSKTRIKIVD